MTNLPAPRIVLYGASGYAALWRDMVRRGFRGAPLAEVVAFIDDFAPQVVASVEGVPVISFAAWRRELAGLPVAVTIGDPGDRRRLAEQVAAAGGRFTSLDYSANLFSASIAIGEGCLLASTLYVGPFTTIGRHVHLNPMASVGHDCQIGDFVTVCASCTISGYVTVEDGVFLGAGSTIVNGTSKQRLIIGAGAFVGAGAVLTRSLPEGARVFGNPARDLL